MIAIIIGDANGVGPEIAPTAFKRQELPDDIVVIGDSTAAGFSGHTEFVAGICGPTTSTASLVAAVEFAFRMVGRTRDFKMHGEFPDKSRP